RAHPRAASVVADTWAGLPVAEHAVDALLCVFAPRNPAEFSRVLAPGGSLVVVVPLPSHLQEIRARHGLLDVPDEKAGAVAAAFPGWPVSATAVERTVDLSAEQARDLIAMGPNAFHAAPEQVDGGTCTVAVTVLRLTQPGSRHVG
ncbi:SAM-dependent methyltransferase, partial [Tessaracoccus lubricantis]